MISQTLSGLKVRDYELGERIGAGGFGAVYRAWQPSVDREVAVKVILPEYSDHPDFIRRFEDEARTVARLENPHIVPLYDYWHGDEGAFLVMRYLKGGSLRERMEVEGPKQPDQIAPVLQQICHALQAAHEQEVVHRDLKPENILLDLRGDAYLADFGIAKDLASPGDKQSSGIVGSVDYLSPEQARAEAVTPASDIYSLGIILFELLIGEHPYPDASPVQQIHRHLNDIVPALHEIRPDLPSALDGVIQRATAKDAANRQANAAEFLQDFTSAIEEREFRLPRRADGRPMHNLPIQMTSFIGRESELQQIGEQLTDPVVRLLTLLGPGGVGKTRLAIEAANSLQAEFPEGIWFIDLTQIADSSQVANTTVSQMDLGQQSKLDPSEQLADALYESNALLIFDNCEHVLEGAASLTNQLLGSCQNLHILATSREPLRTAGELIHHVFPLELPDTERNLDLQVEAESFRLFVDRARKMQPEFSPIESEARATGEICHRLEGMPLALELAAARMTALGVEEIADRLDDRLRLLSRGDRSAPARQQSLQASIEWSYDLLLPKEQLVFNRLSVFRSSAALEAAEFVCAGDGIGPREVMDIVGELVEKSLLIADQSLGKATRYRMLETLREYGRLQLRETGEDESTGRKHAEYYLRLAEQAEPGLLGEENLAWNRRLGDEINEMLAAMDYCADHGLAEWGIRTISATKWFLHNRGRSLQRMRVYLQRFLDSGSDVPTETLMKGSEVAGNFDWFFDSFESAEQNLAHCLSIARESKNTTYEGLALAILARLAAGKGELERADQLLSQAMAVAASGGWLLEHAALWAEYFLHIIDARRAYKIITRVLEISKSSGSTTFIVYAASRCGMSAFDCGRFKESKSRLEESSALFHDLGAQVFEAATYRLLATTSRTIGEENEVERLYRHAADVASRNGAIQDAARAYWGLGDFFRECREFDIAGQALDRAEELLQRRPFSLDQGNTTMFRAKLKRDEGELEDALVLCDRTIELFSEYPNPFYDALVRSIEATIYRRQGEYDKAIECYRSSLMELASGRYVFAFEALVGLAILCSELRKDDLASYLFGCVEAEVELTSVVIPAHDKTGYLREIDRVRRISDRRAIARAWEEGRSARWYDALPEAHRRL